jgi:hypothetical protein
MLASLSQTLSLQINIKKSQQKISSTITSKLDTAGKHCSHDLKQVTNGNATPKLLRQLVLLKPRHGVASVA